MELLQHTASLLAGNGQWNSCNALPQGLGVVGRGTSAMHCLTALGQWVVELLPCTATLPRGSGQCNSCNALPHCLGAVGSGTPATDFLTAWGQWAVQLVQCNATPPGGDGQWNSCNARAHQLGGRRVLPRRRSLPKNRTPAMHCHTAWGRWAVELMQCAGPRAGGTGSPAQEAVTV